MGSQTEQLRHDIEARRDNISETVGEIGKRVDSHKVTFMAVLALLTGVFIVVVLGRIWMRHGKED